MESIDPNVCHNKESIKIDSKQNSLLKVYNAYETHVQHSLLRNLQLRNLLLVIVNNFFITVAINDGVTVVKSTVVPATLSLG